MVGGSDVDYLYLVPVQLLHHQALVVQGDGFHLGPAAAQDAVGLGVAGVFYAIAALPAQQLDQQAGEHLRPGAHHDLGRVRPDAPEAVEVGGNGLPQLGHPLGMGGIEQGVLLLRQHLPHQLGPGGEGKQGGVHGAGGEVVAEGGPGGLLGWG